MIDVFRICRENVLRTLIKQLSKKNGGDDPVWLEEHISHVLENKSLDLEMAIQVHREVLGIGEMEWAQ